MKLNQLWEDKQNACQNDLQQNQLWKKYYLDETGAYKIILGEQKFHLTGTAKELAEALKLELFLFAPFIDGINTSLEAPVAFEEMEEDTAIDMTVVPEKLYYNMLSAKAEWLYTLKEWDGILSEEKRLEITRTWRLDHQAVSKKTVGRNDPCPCGSGKKYKNCCGR